MKFISLASSSSGNCYYLESDETKILIDAGISTRCIKNSLKKFDILIEDIDAVCITHEHNDHIKGIDVLSRAYNIPIYANVPTAQYIAKKNYIKKNDLIYNYQNSFSIKDLVIKSFDVHHDAVSPVGYFIDNSKTKFSILTDTGCVTQEIYQVIKGSTAVLLESNHDIEMLKKGPYPYYLKQRIQSNKGHLSNDIAGRTAVKLVRDGAKNIILGHISAVNNDYQTVYNSISYYLKINNISMGEDVLIDIAQKNEPSNVHIF
jgi:phosphoribosyl 1,2-cyclic phosphodiesterase